MPATATTKSIIDNGSSNKVILEEENSHLLETAAMGENYGSRQAEQANLLSGSNMVHTQSATNSKTFRQYVAALAAAGGAFAAGTLLGWTNPAQVPLTKENEYGFPITDTEFSWVSSAMNLGAACVCIPIGFMINWTGRWLTMMLLVVPFTLGWALLIWAQNVEMMYAARFILGIAGGAFCVTAPMYTGEIAQKDIRGTCGTFFQLMITLGILFVFAIGAGLDVFYISVICGCIPLIFGVVFFFMPETPTYYVSKNREERAVKSIQWLRGTEYDYKPELEELKETDLENKRMSGSVFSALGRRETLKALGISLGLMFFQQLCGINAVIFYSTKIFDDANTGINAQVSTILVGVMQVVATFVSAMVVDKLGRRILLLASALVMVLSTVGLGVFFYLQENNGPESVDDLGWLPVTSLCIFIIMFSIGFGPVPWLMMGELFAADIKGVAGSIAGTSNWVLAFVVTKTFSDLNDAMGKGQTFWLFAGITLIGAIFVLLFVPETKGKSLNEIQDILKGNRNQQQQIQPHQHAAAAGENGK